MRRKIPGEGVTPIVSISGQVYSLITDYPLHSQPKCSVYNDREKEVGFAEVGIMPCISSVELQLLFVHSNVRGQRLGKALLAEVERLTLARGRNVVVGRIIERHAKEFPGLLDWYTKQGYEVKLVSGASDSIAEIRKTI